MGPALSRANAPSTVRPVALPLPVAVAAGAALALAGVVLLVPLPEVGLPLVLGGLRLLGRRFAWARAANARVDSAAAALRRRWRTLPLIARVLVAAVALAAVVLVLHELIGQL